MTVTLTAALGSQILRASQAQPFAPARTGTALTGAYIARPISSRPASSGSPRRNSGGGAAPSPLSASQAQTAPSLPLSLSNSSVTGASDTQQGASQPAAEDGIIELPTGRMLFSHTAEGEGEISVEAGTIVGLIDTSREDWYHVQVGDSEGWVPRSYVAIRLRSDSTASVGPPTQQSLSAALMMVTASAAESGAEEKKEPFMEGEDSAQVDVLAQLIESGRLADVEVRSAP